MRESMDSIFISLFWLFCGFPELRLPFVRSLTLSHIVCVCVRVCALLVLVYVRTLRYYGVKWLMLDEVNFA